MEQKSEFKNIILIGPRASGKSKTSRNLVKYVGYQSLSTDVLVSYEEKGKSIAKIIGLTNQKWPYFRHLEYKILKKISILNNLIIDTGGGILVNINSQGHEILSKRKLNILKKLGYVIYLFADLSYIFEKVINDPERPPLSDKNEFIEIMKKRHPWYLNCCHYKINTTHLNGNQIAKKIARHLKANGFILKKTP